MAPECRRGAVQGRNVDLENTQAEEQVLAELTGGNQRTERPVGGRDHPDVGLPRWRVAHRSHFTVLDGSQKLHLEARCNIADLVQEHRAPVRQLEKPLAVSYPAGERPLDVPEELALDERRAERRQTDRQKRPVAPAAMTVNCPRDQFLATPAFARDEHRNFCRSDQRDALEKFLHRRRRPDERFRGRARPHQARFTLIVLFECPLDDRRRLVEVEWLDQVFKGADSRAPAPRSPGLRTP